MSEPETDDLSPVGIRARARIMGRIMPYLFVLYMIAFLDRVNVSYAVLQMKGELNFSEQVIGTGAGIFFLGYFLLEIPGSILCERWSARGWIARIMVTWGIVAICMGFIQTSTHFYVLRFVLGAAEAGFFPGIIVYFGHWFRYEDRAKAVAMFMAAIPISNIIGAPISGLLLGVAWRGLSGWRWLFIIEGIPAIVFGVITIFYLDDWPHQAKWLPDDEKKWIIDELEREKVAKLARHSPGILESFRHREVVLLTLTYFFMVTAVYGFNFWLPTIVKSISGVSNLKVTLISALPYCVSLITMLVVGWSSDKTGERRWHTAISMAVAGLGLFLSAAAGNRAMLGVAMFCLAGAGMYSYLPGFWALPTSFLTGTVAAASIGLINSVGNLGGFFGPYVVGYISKRTGSYVGGVIYLSVSAVIAAFLVLSIRATRRAPVANNKEAI